MNINDIRTKYLEFYKARGHAIVPSASLIPQNDPTTLFTGSGMQPMISYLLGESHPLGTRIADSQKSFREVDIEEVGDNRHTTFFEMLGNWSLGDYFKQEQLPWMFEFLTKEIGIDPNNLYVTVFAGDPEINIPKDDESIDIWTRLFAGVGIDAKFVPIGSEADGYRVGMQGGRIFAYDVSKNWWSRAGVPSKMPVGEPGGPDSEMFYDFGTEHDPKYGAECHPNCDCGRFMEIGNNVFMEFIKRDTGFERLAQQNVDFGGGLERIAAAAQNNPDVFVAVDALQEIVQLLEHFSGKAYNDSRYQRSFRIVADHMRAVTMMLADGVRFSNSEQGYVLRRLLRRAAQHAQRLEVEQGQGAESILNRCAILIIEKYKGAYPELAGESTFEQITGEIWKEELQFGRTLENGTKELEKIILSGSVSAQDAYTLFTTYGFPFEMTSEIARERSIAVDEEGFKTEMKKHQDLSRAGSEQKFKGGLADHSEQTTRLHTAHHLLLKALQTVLGPEVHQRGSNITSERLRIDFSFARKLTKEEITDVERIVNERIAEALPVVRSTLPKEDAEMLGAEHEFGAKYPDMVSVYSVGPVGATLEQPNFAEAYSIEFCGGPHVSNTSELAGTFKIQKEEAVASGVRRIKAVLQ